MRALSARVAELERMVTELGGTAPPAEAENVHALRPVRGRNPAGG
jgi:hypothetical protein